MKYSLFITAHPLSANAITAYRFTEALLKQSKLMQSKDTPVIFFQQDAVLVANKKIQMPQGEPNLSVQWQALANTYRLSLHCCISSAHRRGLVEQADLAPSFLLSGLGQFYATLNETNKVIHFH